VTVAGSNFNVSSTALLRLSDQQQPSAYAETAQVRRFHTMYSYSYSFIEKQKRQNASAQVHAIQEEI